MNKFKAIFLLLTLVSSSLSSAKDCTLNVSELDLTSNAIDLLSTRYDLVDSDAKYVLHINEQCLERYCQHNVSIMFQSQNGERSLVQSAVGRGEDQFFSLIFADDTATIDAISQLDSCIE